MQVTFAEGTATPVKPFRGVNSTTPGRVRPMVKVTWPPRIPPRPARPAHCGSRPGPTTWMTGMKWRQWWPSPQRRALNAQFSCHGTMLPPGRCAVVARRMCLVRGQRGASRRSRYHGESSPYSVRRDDAFWCRAHRLRRCARTGAGGCRLAHLRWHHAGGRPHVATAPVRDQQRADETDRTRDETARPKAMKERLRIIRELRDGPGVPGRRAVRGTAPHLALCDDSARGRPEGVAADEAQQPGLGSGVLGHLDPGPYWPEECMASSNCSMPASSRPQRSASSRPTRSWFSAWDPFSLRAYRLIHG